MTTACCSRSVRSTVFRSRTSPSSSRRTRWRRCCARRRSSHRCGRCAGAGTSIARSPCCASRADARTRRRFSGSSPTTSWVRSFPQLVACQNENPTGPVEPPDHPLVNQTMYDCLHEVMDVDSLRELVAAHRAKGSRDQLPRHRRAVAARARDRQRQAVHVSRRRAARGAAKPRDHVASWAAGRGARPRRARPRRHCARARRGGARSSRSRRAARPPGRARGDAAGRVVERMVR